MKVSRDLELLRGAFEYTLKQLTPQPVAEEAMFRAVKRSFNGEGAAAYKSAVKHLAPDTIWPERDQRIAEIRAVGNDPARLVKMPIAELLVRRVVMITYAMQRERDMLSNVGDRAHWQFVSVQDSLNPAECSEKHAAVHAAGSHFFDKGPPCWRPDCRCRIRALNARQVGASHPVKHFPG